MSDVLQFIRDAAPELKGVPDGELAAFLSDMAPQLAHVDPEFSAEVSRVKPSESMGAMLSIPHTPDFAGTMNEMFVRMGQLPPNAFNIVQEWAEVGDELSKELPTTPEAIGAVPPSQPMPHLSLGEAKEEFEKSIAPLPDLPDYFFGTDVKAGALAAGYDLVKGMSDFATSLAGMTFMSDPALAKVGAVYMGANMLANSPEAYRQSRAIMDDPNATPAERTRAKLGYFAQVGLGVLSSYGGARPMAKGIASRLDKAIQAERPTTIPLPSESPAEFVARQTEKGAAPSGVAPLTAEVMKEVVPEATAAPAAPEPQAPAPAAPKLGSGYIPPPLELFAQDPLAFREASKQSELSFFKSLGLSKEQAKELSSAYDLRSTQSADSVVKTLSPEARERLALYETGEGRELYQFDRLFDPREVASLDKGDLQTRLVEAAIKGDPPRLEMGDRLAFLVLGLRRFKELGGTWKDISKELWTASTGRSGSVEQATDYFSKMVERFRTVARTQNIDMPMEGHQSIREKGSDSFDIYTAETQFLERAGEFEEGIKELVPLRKTAAPTDIPAGPGAATAGKLGEPRRRKFIVRFKESEEIQPETRVATGNEFYDPRSNQETNAAVNTLIEREGIDGFMARILKDDPLLAGEEKVVGAFNITKRLDKQAKELTDAGRVEEANSLRDRIIDLVETTGERGTLMGRAIQAFRTWDALTPEGVLMDYTRRVKRAQVKALAPHADSVEAAVNELTSEKVASKPRNERVAHIERFPAETTEMRRLLRKNSQKLADLTKQPELFEEFIGKELSAALKIPEVNKEFGRGIMAKVEAAQKLPAGFARDFEMSKIMGEIGREIAPKGLPNAMDIGIAWWYASILSGPATQVVNFVSAALNTASSLGLTAMTHAAHPIAVPWQILKGYVEGIGRGFREARAIITKGDYTRREGGIFTPMTLEQIGPNEPLLARVLSYGKFVGRSMTAADMFNFKGGEAAMTRVALWREGYRSGLRGKALREHVDEVMGTAAEYQVAMRQAEAEGLKGNDIKRRADELVENRVPGKAREEARQYGLEATFNERPYGLVGMVAEGISQLSSKFLPLRFIVPFARIVANVLNEQLNYTPWGYARAYLGSGRFGRLFIPEKYVKIFAGDQLRHQALKASAGTAAMAVMYAWSRWIDDQDKPKVTIHGYGPREPGPRKQWLESGARPYSLEYKGKFFVYLNSPLAMPFAIIGNVRDAERYSKLTLRETGSRLALSTAFAFATIKEQSFLTGLTDFLSAMNVEHGEPNIQAAVNLVGRTATSPVIPAFVKWLDRIWDPRLMQADDILERMARDIPIARSYMKPMINRLGDPVVMEGPARFGMQRFVGREKDDAIWKLIVKNRAWIPYPQKYIVVNGEAIQLTSDEYYDIVKESGKRIKEYLHNNLADLQKRPAGEVRELVEQAAETQTGVVRNPLRMKKIAEQQARRAKEKE